MTTKIMRQSKDTTARSKTKKNILIPSKGRMCDYFTTTACEKANYFWRKIWAQRDRNRKAE